MGRPFKILSYVVLAVVALVFIAAITLFLVFDPNDFRENIASRVKDTTGRELVIEGDLELSLFPWLAIDVGETRLGNAAGFSDEPFASFGQARLSVRLLPVLLRREIVIGTAAIDSLQLNLEVARDGRSNWQDFLELGDTAEEPAASGDATRLDVASIDVSNASVSYREATTGDHYSLVNLNLTSGRVAGGDPVPLKGSFGFELQPAGTTGTIELETVMAFDSDAGLISLTDFNLDGLIEGVAAMPTPLRLEIPTLEANTVDEMMTLGEIELTVFGVDMSASVEPFSYADSVEPVAMLQVDAFSPRSLMQRLDIEAPETADQNALGKVIIDAKVSVGENTIALTSLEMVLDDTKFTGELIVPRSSTGTYRFDLLADTIDLNRYMAPADEGSAAGSDADGVATEIPSDLIQPLKARGNLKIAEAGIGGLTLNNVVLGLNTANGDMRINPISASLYEGTYNGDVRINVAGNTPVISLDEKVSGVLLAPLALAMFEQQNITGTINGAFKLTGRGQDLAAIQRSLGGTMSFELLDGAFEGTDVWYELRRARALLKQEAAPEPVLPPRTQFSSVAATGVVTDGVFDNNDLLAELPFMRLTGKGTVDLPEASLDYRMTARVLERPEFVKGATAEELDEFTEAVIPLRITGPLSSPSIKPDVAGMLKKRVQDELKSRLTDKLFGGSDKSTKEATGDVAGEEPAAEEPAAEEPAKEEDLEDKVKESLFDLLR